MKEAEIKVPILGLVLIGLLITAIIVVLSVLYFQAKNTQKIDTEFRKYKEATQIQIKQKTDTIEYYKAILERNYSEIAYQESEIDRLKNKVLSIPKHVEKLTTSEVYEKTLEYLPEKTDSLKFKYSGNQIKVIYEEHLEKIAMIECIEVYSSQAETLKQSINVLENKCKKLEGIIILQDQDFGQELSRQNLSIEKEKRKNKILGISIPSAGALGVIVGVLIVL